jgi:uncharacterized protein (DUF1330 family)
MVFLQGVTIMSKKGYWIAHVTVKDPQRFADFQEANAAAYEKYKGRFLVRGGPSTAPTGNLRQRHIILEFDSYAAAQACYDSPEYQAAAKIRDQACDIDVVIVEGYGN